MQTVENARPLEVLLVEDNIGDVDLVWSYLRKSNAAVSMSVARDGHQAISVLRNRREHGPLPDIVLLDLNLPKLGGIDVLRVVKEDSLLRRIPVIVLTSSSTSEEIGRVYEMGANCCLTKSIDLTGFRQVMQSIEQFWFHAVCLPTNLHESERDQGVAFPTSAG
ncbi:MAG: response regulator [Pirellulaceae bacterium]|nr:response regulator [Planctomycetales bacterium]